MYVPTVSSTPSAQAQELGQRLYEVVGQYQVDHAGLSSGEVGDAFKIGWAMFRSSPGAADSSQRSVMTIVLGLAIAGLVAALFMTGGFLGTIPHPVMIVVMLLGLAGAVAAITYSNGVGSGPDPQKIAVVVGLILLVLAGVIFLLYRSGAVSLG